MRGAHLMVLWVFFDMAHMGHLAETNLFFFLRLSFEPTVMLPKTCAPGQKLRGLKDGGFTAQRDGFHALLLGNNSPVNLPSKSNGSGHENGRLRVSRTLGKSVS